jgi:hypothetical protein
MVRANCARRRLLASNTHSMKIFAETPPNNLDGSLSDIKAVIACQGC